MKRKYLVLALILCCLFCLSACGSSKINLCDYLIEERELLFTASDDVYNVSLSYGKRETNYNLDGVVNPLTDFAILSINKNDNKSLANDTYAYIININEEPLTGFLTKNETDNSYSTDLEISVPADAKINVKISFTGYTFDQDLVNTTREFTVDKNTALNIANEQLLNSVNNILSTNNNIEVVTKILKDYSSDIKKYYWYVGVVSSNGETLGILLDAYTGDTIAKKV